MRALALTAVVLALAGCRGGESQEWVKLNQPPQAAPSGWTVRSSSLAGFSFSLPADYVRVTGTPEDDDAMNAAIQRAIPGTDFSPQSGTFGDLDAIYVDLGVEHVKSKALFSVSAKVDGLPTDYTFADIEKVTTMPEFQSLHLQPMGKMTTKGGPCYHMKTAAVRDLGDLGKVEMQTHLYYFGREKYFWALAFTYATACEKEMTAFTATVLDTVSFSKPDIGAAKNERVRVAEAVGKARGKRAMELHEENNRQQEEIARKQLEAQLKMQDEYAQRQREEQQQQQPPAEQPPAEQPPATQPDQQPPSGNPPTEGTPPPSDGSGSAP